MKKYFSLILCGLVVLLLTGCGGNGEKTITCVSEKIGENPTIVYYETYVVKDNKITKFDKYSTLDYTDDYLTKLTIDQILEVYADNEMYKASKSGKNQLKLVYVDPINAFEGIEPENMEELIISTMEENAFALYKYTCEAK